MKRNADQPRVAVPPELLHRGRLPFSDYFRLYLALGGPDACQPSNSLTTNNLVLVATVIGVFFIGVASGSYFVSESNRERRTGATDRCPALERQLSASLAGKATHTDHPEAVLRFLTQQCHLNGYQLSLFDKDDLFPGQPVPK